MSRLGNTVGERINQFDNLEIQTVATFNSLFPECPLKFEAELDVEIGTPEANNRRAIQLSNGNVIIHKMYSDILYNVDRDKVGDEREIELTEINGIET